MSRSLSLSLSFDRMMRNGGSLERNPAQRRTASAACAKLLQRSGGGGGEGPRLQPHTGIDELAAFDSIRLAPSPTPPSDYLAFSHLNSFTIYCTAGFADSELSTQLRTDHHGGNWRTNPARRNATEVSRQGMKGRLVLRNRCTSAYTKISQDISVLYNQ